VLQCVAVCYSVLECVAVPFMKVQQLVPRVSVCCSVSLCVKCVGVSCSVAARACVSVCIYSRMCKYSVF